MKKPDSEDMKRAREFMSETSLPISFDSVGGSNAHEENADDANTNGIGDGGDIDSGDAERSNDDDADDLKADGSSSSSSSTNAPAADSSSSLVTQSSSSLGNATSSALFGGAENAKGPSPTLLAKNPYMQVVSKISPSDLIAKFTAESDPRVQEAVRTTILGLIGSLPKLAFETTSVTTGQRLASLVSNKTKNEF